VSVPGCRGSVRNGVAVVLGAVIMVAVDVVAVRSMAVIRPVRLSGLITVFAV
jgi:hypothetical protein